MSSPDDEGEVRVPPVRSPHAPDGASGAFARPSRASAHGTPGGGRTDGKPGPSSSARIVGAQRAWLLGFQLTLLLPFLVTKSCGNGAVEAYTGVGYYFGADRWPFGALLVGITGVLVALPWRGGRDAAGVAGLGLRAWVAGLGAVLAVFGPFLAFLFDAAEPRAGWILHGGGWAGTWLAGTVGTAILLGRAGAEQGAGGAAERAGVAALLVAPAAAGIARLAIEPVDVGEVGLAVLLGYAVVAPLALGGVALARSAAGPGLRALWWLAAVSTALVVLVAGLAD